MATAAVRYLEKLVIARCVCDLLADGFFVTVNDGEEDTLVDSKDAKAIGDAMMTTDEDVLYVRRVATGKPDGFSGWVKFIYGNDGWDVINDYTTNLETVLAKTMALIDDMQA